MTDKRTRREPGSDADDLRARLDRLEALVGRLIEHAPAATLPTTDLERTASAPSAPGPDTAAAGDGAEGDGTADTAAADDGPQGDGTADTAAPRHARPALDERLPAQFWALNALAENVPAPGGVVFAGAVDLPAGPIRYQWARPAEHLLAADWSERADRAAALGHPLRLSILRLLLDGERTVAQLVDELTLGSTGVAYHHLNLLQGAGWVTSPRRGTWAIPASRIIPLLSIVIALEES